MKISMEGNLGCLGSYSNFLKKFLENGFDFIQFNHNSIDISHKIILRHDIDYDVECAYQSALVEYELGIKSTYFFLLRSGFYNLLDENVYSLVLKIQDLGHEISLHFDPLLYKDEITGLIFEGKLFKEIFGKDVKIVSIHRPSEYYLSNDEPINGIEHTYQSKFTKNFKYFSDSTGIWRFGNPLYSDDFIKKNPMQVLIHPVWWFTKGNSNLEILKQIYTNKNNYLKEEFLKNNKLFNLIYEQI